jgi:hypothetical protein
MARFRLASVVLSALLVAELSVAAPPAGLLAHWSFDQGAGDVADDSSGRGNTADLVSADWARGSFGTALRFTGKESYASVPQLAGLDGSDQLTVEAWVLWEATGRYPNIITGGQWSPGGFMIFVSNDHCSFRMGRPAAPAGQPAQPWQETSAPLVQRIETGRWYHLAATFQRPTLTTYVDGKKVGSARWDYPVGYRGDLEIGRWGNAVCHQGLIDDVKIFNRALSADDVRTDYTAQAAGRNGAASATFQVVRSLPQPIATVENACAKLQIDRRGRCLELVEKRTGRNLLSRTAPLAEVTVQGKTLRPNACTYADGKLRLQFGTGDAQLVLGCAAKDRYLTFTVLAVEGPSVERVSFAVLPVLPATRFSTTSGAAVGDDWGLCLRAMNLQTDMTLSVPPLTLRAVGTKEYGLVGCKAGLVVAPPAELCPMLETMVRAEGLPQSAFGGPRALRAEGIRGSYLFAHPSEREVERWIDLAQRGGFTHLHFDGWYKTLGHYEPHPVLFPHGLEGMKTMVRKVHAAGLKAGMHTLTGCIQPRDSWVSPLPDKRLAADASYVLAAGIDEKSDTVLTVERPQNHDVIWSYSGRGNALRIGDEIIQYSAISQKPPYGFLNCTRGAFGTKPAAHRQNEPVDHLRQIYIAFYPDDRTTLVGEVADAIANVFNTCEFDQIYMDGSEGMGSNHAIQTMRDAIFRRLKRPAVVEASCWDHWSWYYHSRIGAWDHPKWGLKPFTDLHCAAIADYRQGALLQAQLGWWVVLGPSPSSRAETPDEMEYFCAKALAFDAPSSTQGVGSLTAPANARVQEYLTMAGWYERLRLANYFPESVKEQLRQTGKDFHLVRDDAGRWQLLPTDYLAHKVTGAENGTRTWRVVNQFAAQPLKLRLEALYSVGPYDGPQAVTIADAGRAEQFTVHRAAPGVTCQFGRSQEQIKTDGASLRLSATSRRESPVGAWAQAGLRFEPYLSITPCDALGVWIHGDGKGEVLNLQLTTPREYSQAHGEHYVTIDFTGWRYFELPLRERDAARHRDYGWPYSGTHTVYMTPVNTAHIDALNLYLGNLPPNQTATVYLGPIKALRTRRVELANPTLDVNGQRLALGVALHSGDYVELDPREGCRVYNERGTLSERVALANVPQLKAGANQFAFSCQQPAGCTARTETTIVAYGAPLTERNPDTQINWALLRDEYDIPRVIAKLDGRDNTWEVACREGQQRVPFGVEIDVEQVCTSDAAYHQPGTLTLESFDDGSFLAGLPSEPAPKPARAVPGKSAAVSPGVTHAIAPSTIAPRIGRAAVRYTATNPSSDKAGWSVVGNRFPKPLDLSKFQALGFWLHGDGKRESFKLQLRDTGRGYRDLVTYVDFLGWRYVQFELRGPGNLDLAKVQGLSIYYNGLPTRDTVTCTVDDIRVLPTVMDLELPNPELTIGGHRLRFPTGLAQGDRLVFDGRTCRVHRKDKPDLEWIQPEGAPMTLAPGRTPVAFKFGADRLPEFRAAVSLVKHYP